MNTLKRERESECVRESLLGVIVHKWWDCPRLYVMWLSLSYGITADFLRYYQKTEAIQYYQKTTVPESQVFLQVRVSQSHNLVTITLRFFFYPKICKCEVSSSNLGGDNRFPVCESRVNLLVYSRSLHRHSHIGFILAFASSIHNKQTYWNELLFIMNRWSES